MRKDHTIDATGKILGRLAAEISLRLRGKNLPGYLPHKTPDILIRVKNVGKIRLTGKKATDKVYIHHTGYPGGIKKMTYPELIKKDPGRALRLAVLRMLPKNRQRAKIMRHLIIS